MESTVVFDNLPKTEAIEDYAKEKLEALVDKLTGGKASEVRVHLAVVNSREHPGEDLFRCRVQVKGVHVREVVVTKTTGNLYKSVALVAKTLHRLLPNIRAKIRDRKKRRGVQIHHALDLIGPRRHEARTAA